MTIATQPQYDAATEALLLFEQQIIQQKRIPPVFLPAPDVLKAYAAQAAKIAVDAALAVKP